MWLIAINPTSGQGRGATMGTKVAGYCVSKRIDYEIVTGVSAQSLSISLKEKSQEIEFLLMELLQLGEMA